MHYTDWSDWDKTNDHSFNNSSSFIKNENIMITDSNGSVIYGFLPGQEAPSLPDTSIEEDGNLAISGSGTYTISTSGITLTYNNNSFHHGMMFTIRNAGLNDSVTVEWGGVRDQNTSDCQPQTADLNGNGAQINNICTSKDSDGKMYIRLQSRSVCNIQLEIFDWVNGIGCN